MKLRLSPNPYTVFFGDKRSETLDANATSHLTELQVHQRNVSKLEIILLACFTMLLVLGFLLARLRIPVAAAPRATRDTGTKGRERS